MIDEIPIENKIDEQEEKPTLFKKIYLFIICLFLIVLILTYIPLFGIWDIVSGVAESSEIKNNEIKFSSKTILFENNSYNKLLNIYEDNKGKEIKVCLIGIFDKDYYVYDLYIPKIYEQDYNHVVSEPCFNSIISLHSHPRMFCIPSKQDFDYFSIYDKQNTLMIVMCKENIFNVYPKGL